LWVSADGLVPCKIVRKERTNGKGLQFASAGRTQAAPPKPGAPQAPQFAV
jgi:hypothetical protein